MTRITASNAKRHTGKVAAEDPMPENQMRAQLYRAAFGRIAYARRRGFPVEAIAMEEGIIADRIRALLRDAGDKKATAKIGVMELLAAARELDVVSGEKVPDKIANWLGSRNQAVHGIVAQRDGTLPKDSPNVFLSRADKIAEAGEELAHDVSNWVERMKTRIARKDNDHGKGK